MIDVDQPVEIISHSHLFHIGKLTVAVTGFDPCDQILFALFRERVEKIDARLVSGKDIEGSHDPDVRDGDRLRLHAFAVAGYAHIPHDIDVADVIFEK